MCVRDEAIDKSETRKFASLSHREDKSVLVVLLSKANFIEQRI